MTYNKLNRFLSSWYKRILTFLGLSFALAIIFTFLLKLYASSEIFIDPFSPLDVIYFAIFLIISILIESFRSGGKWYSIGLRFDKFMINDTLIGIVLSIIAIMFFSGIYLISNCSFSISHPILFNIILIRLFITFCLAATEELLFRGIILQAVLDKFGKSIAIISTSIIFGMGHLFNPSITIISFINTVIVGILFSLAYVNTRSLWLPISFHFCWNAGIQSFLGTPVSGLDNGYYITQFNTSHLNQFSYWLVGGDYGIEGSILTTLLLLVFIFIILKRTSVSPFMASTIFKRDNLESEINYNKKYIYEKV